VDSGKEENQGPVTRNTSKQCFSSSAHFVQVVNLFLERECGLEHGLVPVPAGSPVTQLATGVSASEGAHNVRMKLTRLQKSNCSAISSCWMIMR
jgi:hypothetical protein